MDLIRTSAQPLRSPLPQPTSSTPISTKSCAPTSTSPSKRI